jgi:ribonuclease HII
MPLVKGDAREACISAASILAKTERDRQLTSLQRYNPTLNWRVLLTVKRRLGSAIDT